MENENKYYKNRFINLFRLFDVRKNSVKIFIRNEKFEFFYFLNFLRQLMNFITKNFGNNLKITPPKKQ